MGSNDVRRCMICQRTESSTLKMHVMPGNICLCDDCMKRSMEMASSLGLNPDMLFGNPFQTNSEQGDRASKNPFGFTSSSNGTNAANEADNGHKSGDAENDEDSDVDSIDLDEDNEDKEQEEQSEGNGSDGNGSEGNGFPRFSFLNLGDFDPRTFLQRSNVKKKKPGKHKPLIELKDIPSPHQIKAQLDEYVVGQEHAKKVMSVAVYNHYKRVATDTMDDIEIEKSNILMIGPTGCGKTYLVKTLARLLNVPLAIADATSLTEAGYIGDDIESVVSKLLAAADNDVDKAEQGIIYIDEIDKIAKKENSHNRDVSGESVQQGMLKLLEGADIEVPIGASSKNAMVPTAIVNTKNILFICGGAFSGMEEKVKQRLTKQSSIGFNAELKDRFNNEKNILMHATIEDVKKFGMIPEFVGRLPMFFSLESMTEDMLVRVLKEPKNAIIKQYQKLLRLDEVDLVFTEDALHSIAKKALEKETGARGLRAVIDEFMLDIMYEIPKDDNIGTVTIDKDYVEGKGGPIITMRGAQADC